MPPATPEDLARATRLRRSVSQLSRRLRPHLQGDGLGMAALSVVGRLARAGRQTASALAAAEGVRQQTLTRLLAELETGGWISRTRDEADARRVLIALTAGGRRRLADAARAGDQGLAAVLAATLDEGERALLHAACALFERLDDALVARAARP